MEKSSESNTNAADGVAYLNEELKMTYMREHEPWSLDDLPVQYFPIPGLERWRHDPPLFVFGIGVYEKELWKYARHVGILDAKTPVTTNTSLNILSDILVRLDTVCKSRNHFSQDTDLGDYNLSRKAKKLGKEFAFMKKKPKWYIESSANDLSIEDYPIDISGLEDSDQEVRFICCETRRSASWASAYIILNHAGRLETAVVAQTA
ncbi:hypothetical protein MPER_02968 [Moniliophthora perniciosa FA553]|nr:hypothetical protein MPER_02968 [Moniliophthora perniciosa FA553]